MTVRRVLPMVLVVGSLVVTESAWSRSARRPVGAAARARTAQSQQKLEAAAKRRYDHGTRAYRKGEYRSALRLYQAAAELVWRPSLAYNIALCHDKLKEFNQAILYMRRFLASKPDARWAVRARSRLRILLSLARVKVRFTSYPSGAAIYIDGKANGLRGRTPATLELPPGRFRARLEASGHEPRRRVITVDVGARNYFDFQLKRQSALKVAASVPGALVAIDDQPAVLAPIRRIVSPGAHRIAVHKEGYYTINRVVRIGPGEQATVFIDLRPTPRYGFLRVRADVTGAIVQVEADAVGETPLSKHKLRTGTYRVYVKKKHYQTWERRVTIISRQLTVLNVHLSPLRSKRQLAWFIAGSAVTGLLLASGVIMTLTAVNAKAEYEDLPRAALRTQGKQFALAADTLIALGILTGGITAFLTWRLKPAPSKGEVIVTPLLGPGLAGISAGGRF